MTYDDYQHLTFERRPNGVLVITLNRPDKLNATNERLHRELAWVWRTVADDAETRVAVATGAGRAFSAGGDLDWVAEQAGDIDAVADMGEQARDIVYGMMHLAKPVVSAINGIAVGAGLAVALTADVSIIAESAKLSDGHTRIGVAAGDHALMLWPLFCPLPKAKYYLLTADAIDAAEAERIGLVSLCVPDDELMDRAFEIADRLATGPQQAIRWTKRCLNHWLLQAAPIFDLSAAYEGLNFMSRDAREGISAFHEKRPPRFPSAGS